MWEREIIADVSMSHLGDKTRDDELMVYLMIVLLGSDIQQNLVILSGVYILNCLLL